MKQHSCKTILYFILCLANSAQHEPKWWWQRVNRMRPDFVNQQSAAVPFHLSVDAVLLGKCILGILQNVNDTLSLLFGNALSTLRDFGDSGIN